MNHVEETQQKQRGNILRQWSTIDKFRYKIVFIICAQAVEDAYLRTECIASIKACMIFTGHVTYNRYIYIYMKT